MGKKIAASAVKGQKNFKKVKMKKNKTYKTDLQSRKPIKK